MTRAADTTVVILCGGRGTRLQGDGAALPKPLVEIGGRPIVWHVVMSYYANGFRNFLLLTGYLGDQIAEFVAEAGWPDGARVEAIDTGIDTPTGGRVRAVADRLGGDPFCLTYADGLIDADLATLLEDHCASGAAATVTVVRPQLPFGVVRLSEDDLVEGFAEKPQSSEWVNGGFLFAGPELLAELEPDEALEGAPLEALVDAGTLRAARHEGFWACMDTYKEASMLNDLWESGEAPWRRW